MKYSTKLVISIVVSIVVSIMIVSIVSIGIYSLVQQTNKNNNISIDIIEDSILKVEQKDK